MSTLNVGEPVPLSDSGRGWKWKLSPMRDSPYTEKPLPGVVFFVDPDGTAGARLEWSDADDGSDGCFFSWTATIDPDNWIGPVEAVARVLAASFDHNGNPRSPTRHQHQELSSSLRSLWLSEALKALEATTVLGLQDELEKAARRAPNGASVFYCEKAAQPGLPS